jgi:hypothetical protein
MRHALLPLAAALSLAVSASASLAAPSTFWAQFPAGPFAVGVPATLTLADGSHVDLTVQTGGTQGVNGSDSDTLGSGATGLAYDHLYVLGIFNGGGSGTVPTTLTFSNVQVSASHRRGLLLVGAVNGQSSPVTVTSSVGGRVATWTVVGETFAFGPNNAFPIDWDPAAGQFRTNALSGNDSRCIVLDLGDLRTDGTITVSLQQYLADGIVYAFGEELSGSLGVPEPEAGTALRLAPPRPNPAREGVALEFALPAASHVRMAAFDLAGRRLAILANGEFGAGTHDVPWDLHDAAGARVRAGLVFVRLETRDGERTQRLLVLP